jgi:hypothetical protein
MAEGGEEVAFEVHDAGVNSVIARQAKDGVVHGGGAGVGCEGDEAEEALGRRQTGRGRIC